MPAQRCVGWALPEVAERKPSPAERGRVLGSTSRTCPAPSARSLCHPTPPHAPAPPTRALLGREMLAEAGLAPLCDISGGCPMSAPVQCETEVPVFCPGNVSSPSVCCHLCPRLLSHSSRPGDDHGLQSLSPQHLHDFGVGAVCILGKRPLAEQSGKSWWVYR